MLTYYVHYGDPKLTFIFKFLVSTENFVPIGKIMDLAKDLAWQKIFRDRSTNLKIEKLSFFCIFATLTPYFISFSDTQWAYKTTTEIVYYATRAYSISLRTGGAPIARVCKEVRPSCIRYFMQFCVESSI